MKIRQISAILLSLSCISASAQDAHNFDLIKARETAWQNEVDLSDGMQYGPTPADAVSYAVADLSGVPEEDQPFQRYVWIPDGDEKKHAYVSFAVNIAISQATNIVKPEVVADGKLLRWDLRRLAPRDGQYSRLHALWEKLAFEPYFHITTSTAEALPTDAAQIDSHPLDPYGSARFKSDGVIYYKSPNDEVFAFDGGGWSKKNGKVKRVATPAAHAGLEQSVLLQGMSQSNSAMVRYDFLIVKALSTADGGMYYEFTGIDANPSRGTAQDAFLRSLGASQDLVAKLRADQRAAMFRSRVTGKPRRIDAFYGVGVRPGSGAGLITITHDIFDNDVNPLRDPVRNLLNFKDRAREIIGHKPNGLQIFALFDGEGNLQKEVPPNVAKDHTIPNPHTGRLQPAIGCIRCHGPHDGYQPFENEIKTLLGGSLDVFGDVASELPTTDQLDRLAGLYAGDLSKPVNRARDDYSDAVFIATDGMSVAEVSAGVSQIYADYIFDDVGAFEACVELGYLVPSDQAVQYINEILPPLNQDVIGVRPEDPIIGALKTGLRINRFQWESVYADAAFRALQSRLAHENINEERPGDQ